MLKILKICVILLSVCLFVTAANAENVFSDIKSINKIKCSGTLVSGSINEYDNAVQYYTFKDDKIYSSNLNNLFGNITKPPKKVLKLKISDDYITFKERLYKFEGAYYKWVKIDRKTGEYVFNAKNDYGFFFKRANVKGTCSIES